MAILSTWQPKPIIKKIESDTLLNWIVLSEKAIKLSSVEILSELLNVEDQKKYAYLMNLSKNDWHIFLETLTQKEDSYQTVENYVYFFTLAEQAFVGWNRYPDRSPVIAMVSYLKSHQQWRPEIGSWIKSHTQNRFLPYGNLMDLLS